MMTLKKEYIGTLGLLLITVWSALQYIFLQNVPDSVSTFSFIFITNLIGIAILSAVRHKKLKLIRRGLLPKGMLLAGELIGFNFFLILGSRGMDSVVASSLVSMYFVFVTPMLLLLRKKVSFRSAVASAVAIIALLLMFNANLELLFSSRNVVFMFIADLFFAAYIITVSEVGANEDPTALTISQMMFSTLFSFGGWLIEIALGGSGFSLPRAGSFWVSALFVGVFIRALYGLIQMSCQKYVQPVNASLIFASEIIITLITNPFMSRLMGTEYTPATLFQVIGCVLFVISVIVVDDTIMARIGYTDMEVKTYVDEDGVSRTQSTLSRKLTNTTLIISMTALLISTVICIGAISRIKDTAVEQSTQLGYTAADASEKALKAQLELELITKTTDKAALAQAKLTVYVASIQHVADTARAILDDPAAYPAGEVMIPLAENAGKWTMQRVLADESVEYARLSTGSLRLGNLESILQSVVTNSENIATIYMGTEDGLLVSYDPDSGSAATGGESYYEFRDADWYTRGKMAREPFFTKAYQDSYGRGLTITCVAPVYDSSGAFQGCIGIDVLINDLNQSMINDNIVDPNYATLIDNEGYVIADKNVDAQASGSATIYDAEVNTPIREASQAVLGNQNGITSVGDGEDAVYIAYSEIPLTDWKLCIMSPVSNIIQPAVVIRSDIDRNTTLVAGTVNSSISQVVNSCLVIFAVILLAITYAVGKLADRITTPLRLLEQDVLEISQGRFDQRTHVSTNDEIGSLARAFNHMTQSLQDYIADLKTMTAREERIASELSVATDIQASMLPRNFEQLNCGEFSVYATMNPAREVGGDFYDFFLVDDDHLALVIADVSGKGVPAALFMVIAKTLIKNHTQSGRAPEEVFTAVNRQLCESNDEGLFVTAWLGVLELSTGQVTYVNAGHNPPLVALAGADYAYLQMRQALFLAGLDGTRYQSGSFRLEPGDSLYLYTDGVTEATDAAEELYGEERLRTFLNAHRGEAPEQLLPAVKEDIDRFVGQAPQYDDITMLCLEYRAQRGALKPKEGEVT